MYNCNTLHRVHRPEHWCLGKQHFTYRLGAVHSQQIYQSHLEVNTHSIAPIDTWEILESFLHYQNSNPPVQYPFSFYYSCVLATSIESKATFNRIEGLTLMTSVVLDNTICLRKKKI